jgi:hypothetical protein
MREMLNIQCSVFNIQIKSKIVNLLSGYEASTWVWLFLAEAPRSAKHAVSV